MDDERARALLAEERHRVTGLVAATRVGSAEDRDAGEDPGDWGDGAQPLTAEGADDAVGAGLSARLDAVGRAEGRLDAGTYGRSVRSGTAIPDERLKADPAAELTVEEAAADPDTSEDLRG